MPHPYHPLHAPHLQPQLHLPSHCFREFAPSRRLASHVAAYWTVDFLPVPGNPGHRVIPDGCVDIIVDLFASSSRQAAYVVGLTTQVEVLQFVKARSVWGIRLYSESARTIPEGSNIDITDKSYVFGGVLGARGSRLGRKVADCPIDTRQDRSRRAAIEPNTGCDRVACSHFGLSELTVYIRGQR